MFEEALLSFARDRDKAETRRLLKDEDVDINAKDSGVSHPFC